MGKTKAGVFVFIIVIILSACVAVPENVQRDVDVFRQAREEAEKLEKEMNFVRISDVYKNTPKTVQYKKGIVSIDAKVCVPQADKMYKLELVPNDLYAEKDNALQFFPDGGLNVRTENPQIIKDIPPSDSIMHDGIEIKSFGSKGVYSAVWGEKKIVLDRCGKLFLYNNSKKSEKHFIPFTLNLSTEKKYFYYEAEDSLQEYVCFDGEDYMALEMWKQFQKNIDYLGQHVPDFDYKPYYMEIYKEDNSTLQSISCRAVYEYNGVGFDPICIVEQDKKNYGISRVGFGFYQHFHSPDDDCFLALRDSYKVTKELESYDKILDLDSAVKLLQTSLAKERFANIDTIELMYGMYYYGDKDDEWASSYEEPPRFYAEPYWKFTEKANGEDEENMQQGLTVHYVNAVTGQFYSYNKSCLYIG